MCAIAHAATETINWYMDGNTYATTQCETGSDIILPQTPYKYGYTFQGWGGYIPIEYLQSSGSQYIDTGIKGTDILRTNIMIQITPGFVKADQKLFGVSETGKGMYFTSFQGFYRGTNIPITTSKTEIEIIRTDIVANTFKATVSYDGNDFTTTSYWTAGPSTINTFPVFAGVNGTNGIIKSVYRCYSLRLYNKKDRLIRDMIPVLDSNGTPCMFDKVEQKFYYNQGTGDFIAGPIIN